MGKFIIGTFLLLGFGFYELSGGADFEPDVRPIAPTVIATTSLAIVPFDAPVVTRAALETAPLVAIEDAEVITALLEVAPSAAESPVAVVDVRQIAGKRVNMRSGPGTNYGVLDTLTRGMQTEVLEVNANGWARVLITTTGQIGWMAERLLTNG
ncbi:MAG: SH3 domain-containing protein [Yoonia sp.]|nr:SH3 domain-containing protein [Yoonia sp.]